MPPSMADTTHNILITVGSTFRYSPIPPQTPASFLLVLDLYSFLVIALAPFCPVLPKLNLVCPPTIDYYCHWPKSSILNDNIY